VTHNESNQEEKATAETPGAPRNARRRRKRKREFFLILFSALSASRRLHFKVA
jgi:hypothetical protein